MGEYGPSREPAKREGPNFLTEFLKGSREKVAIGLGALILSMSGAAAAQEGTRKHAGRADDELDREVEAVKVTPEDVATARKFFDNTVDLLSVSQEAKSNIRKALDATLSSIPDLEEQVKTITMFREQVEARLQKKETSAPTTEPKKEEKDTRASVVFSSEKASGRVVAKHSLDGKQSLFVVEGETSVSEDDLVKVGLLKSDFKKYVKGFKNIGLARTAVEARMRTLFLLQEAVKAAKAQGNAGAAADLERQIREMKERIKDKMGEIIP
ncbi:MAG: hypothetical protein HY569_01290 [Candidatus Magasanikbacteria bacterium]|nr:hypothetical protein [Candidatus Magasanikbacteria bacterium]